MDKINNELEVLKSDIAKLSEKGYPEQMVDWCLKKCESIRSEAATGQERYNSIVTSTSSNKTLAELESEGMLVDGYYQALDTKHQEWKKEQGAEIKNITA